MPKPRRRRRPPQGPLAPAAALFIERRQALDLTQQELSELADISLRRVQELEDGSASLRLTSLLRVADALGLAVAALPRSALHRVEAIGGAALELDLSSDEASGQSRGEPADG